MDAQSILYSANTFAFPRLQWFSEMIRDTEEGGSKLGLHHLANIRSLSFGFTVMPWHPGSACARVLKYCPRINRLSVTIDNFKDGRYPFAPSGVEAIYQSQLDDVKTHYKTLSALPLKKVTILITSTSAKYHSEVLAYAHELERCLLEG